MGGSYISTRSASAANGLSSSHIRILEAIRKLQAAGVEHPIRLTVALLAGFRPNTGTFNTYMSRLRVSGLIEYVGDGSLHLTPDGLDKAPDGYHYDQTTFHGEVARIVGPPRWRILRALIESYPDPLGRETVAEQAGYKLNTGTFNTYMSGLRTMGVLDYAGKGLVVATKVLFPTRAD